MKKFYAIFFLITALAAQAQQPGQLHLRAGDITVGDNISQNTFAPAPDEIVNGRYYRFIRFSQLPMEAQKKQMEDLGIRFLNYIPDNAYIVSIPQGFDLSQLKNFGAAGTLPNSYNLKMTPALLNGDLPDYAQRPNDEAEIIVDCYSDIPMSDVLGELKSRSVNVLKHDAHMPLVNVRVKKSRMDELAKLPFVSFVEPCYAPGEPEELLNRSMHRTNTLSADFSAGRQYTGAGINIMIQDDGIIGPHIDYTGRIGAQYVVGNNGDHGDHCSGIIMGAGNKDPNMKGMAPGATLWVYNATWNSDPYYQGFDSIYTHYTNKSIKITSTSYSDGCNAGYTSLAQKLDNQIRTMPLLIHVFSAGNQGTANCNYGAGAGWGNITGGHKMAKNVLTVASLDYMDNVTGYSSRGPGTDGRVKPDVSAMGDNVFSTISTNNYTSMSGTSMACPGTSGTLAALYHAYKLNNGNAYPESALMKAILMNTADDLGNPGPDFKYGYGRINGLRAAKTIEQNRFFSGSISQSGTNTHNITVPANTKQVRVMICWSDYEAAVNSNPSLVNDLNMSVKDPTNTSYNPWKLDYTPNAVNLNANATRGVDNRNVMEQFTLDNPAAGTYTITITAPTVPQGPQKYWIAYENLMDELTVTYPNGGEGFAPGDIQTIRWDSYGTAGSFNLEYSNNNGVTWNTIATAVPASQRYYDWTVPNDLSGQCLVRVTRGSVSDVSDAGFSIIGIPTALVVIWCCPDSMRLQWNAVTGATSYECSLLGSMYMDSVGVTTGTAYTYKNVQSTNTYWVSVKARGPQGAVGRRAIALQKTPGVYGCTVGMNELANSDATLNVYPNPSEGLFNIRVKNIDGDKLTISVTDIAGKEILLREVPLSGNLFNGAVDLSNVPKGVYMLNVRTATKQFHTKLGNM